MGFRNLIGLLNPFAFSRKQDAAWNALMAAYTFEHISDSQREEVVIKSIELLSLALRKPVSHLEMAANLSTAQRYLLYSLAMINIGIRPAIGNDLWNRVRNPYVDLLNSKEIMAYTQQKLEKEYLVDFPTLS